jgi:hypothetical protein
MTTEVTKYSVYDPRVIQTKPKYAVEKGALSLTNVSFNAQTANSSTQQFNVIVPSENVFIDRAVEWISGGVIQIPVTLTFGSSSTVTAGVPLMSYNDIALAAFPSHQTVAQMTATINDATVTVNTQDVLANVLRLQDLEAHRRQRTCPTMLDRYAYNYPVNTAGTAAQIVTNSPQGGYGQHHESDDLPNGAWSQFYFCDSTGAPLTAGNNGTGTSPYGLPLTTGASGTSGTTTTQNVYVRWQSAEHLLLPPFIFGDAFELSTGLFGVQNFQVQMNLLPSPSRAVRINSDAAGQVLGGAGGATATYGTPAWATLSTAYSPNVNQPSLSVQFLTPALDVPLPPKSIVPYMEFPRYITTGLPAIAGTIGTAPTSAKGVVSGATQITTNTITLPNIPDLIMIYLKPTTPGATGVFTTSAYTTRGGAAGPTAYDSTIADFTLPVQAISLNFDNFSGLLANHTQYQLYKMSVNNGLTMDFPTWCGESRSSATWSVDAGLASANAVGTPYTSTSGGPLVLRPGRDFALQAGQAPGLVGNFTFQATVTVGCQFVNGIAAGGVSLYVVPISTGFFETIKGSSRIIKGVLTEQDILSAAAHAPDADLQRMVGSGKEETKMEGGRHKRAAKMGQYM